MYRIARSSGCNAIQEYLICASFPTTVLTVSGSRVSDFPSPISAEYIRHPEDLCALRSEIIVANRKKKVKAILLRNRRILLPAAKSRGEHRSSGGCLLRIRIRFRRIRRCLPRGRAMHAPTICSGSQHICSLSFWPPKMWKCRCWTLWQPSSPQLLTTR